MTLKQVHNIYFSFMTQTNQYRVRYFGSTDFFQTDRHRIFGFYDTPINVLFFISFFYSIFPNPVPNKYIFSPLFSSTARYIRLSDEYGQGGAWGKQRFAKMCRVGLTGSKYNVETWKRQDYPTWERHGRWVYIIIRTNRFIQNIYVSCVKVDFIIPYGIIKYLHTIPIPFNYTYFPSF